MYSCAKECAPVVLDNDALQLWWADDGTVCQREVVEFETFDFVLDTIAYGASEESCAATNMNSPSPAREGWAPLEFEDLLDKELLDTELLDKDLAAAALTPQAGPGDCSCMCEDTCTCSALAGVKVGIIEGQLDGGQLDDSFQTAGPQQNSQQMQEKPSWASTCDSIDYQEHSAIMQDDESNCADLQSRRLKRAGKRNRQRKNKLVDPAARPSEYGELECFMHSGTDERSVSSLYVSLLEIELSAKQCGHDIAILGCDCHKPDQLAQYEVMLSSNGVSTICQACSDYY
jgi:hypothetical protein